MTELDYKKQFAAHLLKNPANPFDAAIKIFGDDVGNACKYAKLWPLDDEVIAEMELLKARKSISDSIATKLEAASAAWVLANNDWLKGKERVDALRLFAEMAGYMPDKTVNKNINAEVKVNKVMVVKDHGEDKDWEAKIEAQQKALVNAK